MHLLAMERGREGGKEGRKGETCVTVTEGE